MPWLCYIQDPNGGSFYSTDGAGYTPYNAQFKHIGWGRIPALVPGYNINFFETIQTDPQHPEERARRRILCVHSRIDTQLPPFLLPLGFRLDVYEVLDYSECHSTALATDLQIKVGQLGELLRPLYRALYEQIRRNYDTLATPERTTPERSTPDLTAAMRAAVVDTTVVDTSLVATLTESQQKSATEQNLSDFAFSFGSFDAAQSYEAATPTVTTTAATTVASSTATKVATAAKPAAASAMDSLDAADKVFEYSKSWFNADAPEEFICAVARICAANSEFAKTLPAKFKNIDFNILLSCICISKVSSKVSSQLYDIDPEVIAKIYLTIFEAFWERRNNDKDRGKIDTANQAWSSLETTQYIASNPRLFSKIQDFCEAQTKRAAAAAAATALSKPHTPQLYEPAIEAPVNTATPKAPNTRQQKEQRQTVLAKRRAKETEEMELLTAAIAANKAATPETKTAANSNFAAIEKEISASNFATALKMLGEIDKTKLASLLEETNAMGQNLLMLALASKGQNSVYKDLVLFLINNSGASICNKDNESKNVLSYFVGRDLEDINAWDKTRNRGPRPNNAEIFDALFKKFLQHLPDEIKKALQLGSVDYLAVQEFLQDERGSLFLLDIIRDFDENLEIKPKNIYALNYLLRSMRGSSNTADGNISFYTACIFAKAADGNLLAVLEQYFITASFASSKETKLNLKLCEDLLQQLREALIPISIDVAKQINPPQAPKAFTPINDIFDLKFDSNNIKAVLNGVKIPADDTEKQANNALCYRKLASIIEMHDELRSVLPKEAYSLVFANDICALLLFTDDDNERQDLLKKWVELKNPNNIYILLANIAQEACRHLCYDLHTYDPKAKKLPVALIISRIEEMMQYVTEEERPRFWNSIFNRAAKEYMENAGNISKNISDDVLALLNALATKCDVALPDTNGKNLTEAVLGDINVALETTQTPLDFIKLLVPVNKLINILIENSTRNNITNIATKNTIFLAIVKMYLRADDMTKEEPGKKDKFKYLDNVLKFYVAHADKAVLEPGLVDDKGNNVMHKLFMLLNQLVEGNLKQRASPEFIAQIKLVIMDRITRILIIMLERKTIADQENLLKLFKETNNDSKTPLDLITNGEIRDKIKELLRTKTYLDLDKQSQSHKP